MEDNTCKYIQTILLNNKNSCMKENIALKKPKQHESAIIYTQYQETQSKVEEWHIAHPGGFFNSISTPEGF